MTFDQSRAASLVAMLRAEPPNVAIREVANQLEAACGEIERLRAERDAMRAVFEAAKAWRQTGHTNDANCNAGDCDDCSRKPADAELERVIDAALAERKEEL